MLTKKHRLGPWIGGFLFMFVTLFCVSCSGASQGGPDRSPAMLQISALPEDPLILIDGEDYRYLGDYQGVPIPLEPGYHRLELRAEGHYPHRRDLELKPGRVYTLTVHLVRHLQ